jgi:hypothetical protein
VPSGWQRCLERVASKVVDSPLAAVAVIFAVAAAGVLARPNALQLAQAIIEGQNAKIESMRHLLKTLDS